MSDIGMLNFIGHIVGEFVQSNRIYFLWFIIYGFAGWLYESTICSLVKYHHLINRGFLKGPICPIYGVGAVGNYLLLGRANSAVEIFFAAMITSAVVEYLTSYVMEMLFHQRWWDYTRYKFNLHGRICLYGCVVFGIANVVMLKFVHPYTRMLTSQIPERVLAPLVLILYCAFLTDVLVTTLHMESVNERMANYKDSLRQKREVVRSNMQAAFLVAGNRTQSWKADLRVISTEGLTVRLQNMKNRFQDTDWRLRQFTPLWKNSRYHELLEKIKDRFGF